MSTSRAAVYQRVSTEEQVEGYSLYAQQRATRLFCESKGWIIAKEYRDEGKSARTDDLAKRPEFAAMLEDAEAGMFDVIVVHKLDRFARNLRVTLDTLDRLDRCGVAFVSINENMDYSTPMGKVMLSMLASFAQYYSDNLSWETKKGKAERKRQGMYNGLLPFGVTKNADGLPVPVPETYSGLLLAFRTAADGKSDREVALALNAHGFRTSGNRGQNSFTKDSVKVILTNRFYLGELPEIYGSWIPAKHAPMIDCELFAAAQAVRVDNRTNHASKVRATAQVYSLSGLARCAHCRGPLHIVRNKRGARPRLYCYNRVQGQKCTQRSTFLDVYEAQLADYLETFVIPSDYCEQVIALHANSKMNYVPSEERQRQLEARLARIKEMYSWGDLERGAYQLERDSLTTELGLLRSSENMPSVLEQTAALLENMPAAWSKATQEQRNALARLMFEQIVVENRTVAAVEPRPEFRHFFTLDYQRRQQVLSRGSDGERRAMLKLRIPLSTPTLPASSATTRYSQSRNRIAPDLWPQIATRHHNGESLRRIATSFGVSHEAVRQIVKRVA